MRVKINVTQDHINRGKRRNNRLCPVAKALKPLLKKGIEPKVGTKFLWIGEEEFGLPTKAVNFISEFDWVGKTGVKPLNFTMNLPKELLR